MWWSIGIKIKISRSRTRTDFFLFRSRLILLVGLFFDKSVLRQDRFLCFSRWNCFRNYFRPILLSYSSLLKMLSNQVIIVHRYFQRFYRLKPLAALFLIPKTKISIQVDPCLQFWPVFAKKLSLVPILFFWPIVFDK